MTFNQYAPLVWLILKFLLFFIVIALAFGLVIGFFTYGQPRRTARVRRNFLDDVMDIGTDVSHLLISQILKFFRKGSFGSSWLSDQQILAMMRGMTPSAFEEFIARMFEKLGYRTELVGGSGDGGIDIEMTKDGRRFVVQCKKFITRKVNPHDIRDFFGSMGDRHIDGKGFFITTNIFTLEAERFAEGKPIEMIDGTSLIRLVRESGVLGSAGPTLSAAQVQPVENCPNCGRRLVLRTNKNDGTRFWGCSGFPDCRFTKPA